MEPPWNAKWHNRTERHMSFKYTENQEAWLTALESGEITQCQSYLGLTDGRRCCLGVACDLAGVDVRAVPGKYKGTIEILKYGNLSDETLGDWSINVLPEVARQWIGLQTHNGTKRGDTSVCLTQMNDLGKSFKQIAAAVRKNPEWYFVAPADVA